MSNIDRKLHLSAEAETSDSDRDHVILCSISNKGGYVIADQYGTHFITLTIIGWVDLFTRQECRDIMIESFKYCQKNKGLIINAFVIMSNHIHMIIRADEHSDGLSAIIRDMKKHTSKELLKWVRESKKESRKEWLEVVFKYHAKYNSNNKTYQIWQQNNQPKCKPSLKF